MLEKVKAFFKNLLGAIKALFKGQEMAQEQKKALATTIPVACGVAGAAVAIAAMPGTFVGTVMVLAVLVFLAGGLLLVIVGGYLIGRDLGQVVANAWLK